MNPCRVPLVRFAWILLFAGAECNGVHADCSIHRKHFHLAVGRDPATSMTISFASELRCSDHKPETYSDYFGQDYDVKSKEDDRNDEIASDTEREDDDSGDEENRCHAVECHAEEEEEDDNSRRLLLDPTPIGYVLIGTDPANLDRLVKEASPATRYSARYLNTQVDYQSPFFHHVTLDGLQPNTTYYYECVAIGGNSAKAELEADGYLRRRRRRRLHHRHRNVASFQTAPHAGSEQPVKFAIFGDMGRTDKTVATMRLLNKHRQEIDAAILVGDVAYSRLQHHKWDNFFDMWDKFDFIGQVPVQVALGNHDIDRHPATGLICVAFDHRFRMPEIQPVKKVPHFNMAEKFADYAIPYPIEYDYGNAYYAFTYGMVRNIVLSSYSSFEANSKQRKWLESELTSIDRTTTPWVTLTLHVPIYNTFYNHHDDYQALIQKQNLEPLLVRHRVNFVFSGHVHAYQRSLPVVHEGVDRKGPIYIIVGEGGYRVEGDFLSKEPEEWVAARDATFFGYGSLSFCNRSHAFWQWNHSYRESDQYNHVAGQPDGIEPVFSDSAYVANQLYM